MARHIHRRRTHKRHHKRSSKNFINKTVEQGVSVVSSTSRKLMPNVKHGLTSVGTSVIKTGEQSVPFLQKMSRKFASMFGSKTKKHRRHH